MLVARPHELVDQWSFRLAEFEASNDATRARIIADLATKSLSPGARARLERLARGLALQRERIVAVLGEAGISALARKSPEPEGVPSEGSITSYLHHVHRDWAWDDQGSIENREALAAVARVLEPQPQLGAVLVIGAGACRLASDLHAYGRADVTIAVDINPLPMLIARRVIAGESVRLVELPVAPRDLEHVFVERSLHAEHVVREGFVQLFADAFALPFASGSFDTVVTPWFIDQVPRDLASFLPVIRGLLRPGGRWINHGPLIYHPSHTELAARYASDEVLALAKAAGLVAQRSRADRLPYLQSPACSRGRAEMVFTFVAARVEVVEPELAAPASPVWIVDRSLSVPRFDGLDGYEPPHPLFGAVVRLIDGERSTDQIAAVLVRDFHLPVDAAAPGVGSCLAEIWRATRQ